MHKGHQHSRGRRQLLRYAGASLILSVSSLAGAAAKQASVLSVRIWPAADYTRVTLEHNAPLKFTHFTVENPDRLVVDIEGVELNSVLDSISRKVATDDPYIKLLRAGRYKPDVVRLVMELKAKVTPQIFEVKPVGEYGYRLVLDVYPVTPVDPLMSLVEGRKDAVEPLQLDTESKAREAPTRKVETTPAPEAPEIQTTRKSGKPIVDRLVTITLDPGHGGEDPGAVGS
ncbi:MAG: AMIN domain-containing protein, partial [Candidatus Dechloromonas phosphoritropha]